MTSQLPFCCLFSCWLYLSLNLSLSQNEKGKRFSHSKILYFPIKIVSVTCFSVPFRALLSAAVCIYPNLYPVVADPAFWRVIPKLPLFVCSGLSSKVCFWRYNFLFLHMQMCTRCLNSYTLSDFLLYFRFPPCDRALNLKLDYLFSHKLIYFARLLHLIGLTG